LQNHVAKVINRCCLYQMLNSKLLQASKVLSSPPKIVPSSRATSDGTIRRVFGRWVFECSTEWSCKYPTQMCRNRVLSTQSTKSSSNDYFRFRHGLR
jgi:hypothetical protein